MLQGTGLPLSSSVEGPAALCALTTHSRICRSFGFEGCGMGAPIVFISPPHLSPPSPIRKYILDLIEEGGDGQ